MRRNLIYIVFFAGSFSIAQSQAIAGDTLVGPSQNLCSKFTSDSDAIIIMNMWIEGFLSAANRLNKSDFLENVSASDIAKYSFIDCQNNPNKTVEEVALDTLGNFRVLYVMNKK
jgi:hypothetical protein